MGLQWRCSGRPDSLDDELISLMAGAGCRSMFMGIESGSVRIQEMSRKRLRLGRTLPGIRTLISHNLEVTASFIAGFPYETEADLEETLVMMSTINNETRGRVNLQVYPLLPIPGAPLQEEPGVCVGLDTTTPDPNGYWFDATMREWIRGLGAPIFGSFYHYRTPAIQRTKLITARTGWSNVFTHLRLTGIALEEARRADGIRLLDIFADGTIPESQDSDLIFRWCFRTLKSYLENSDSAWSKVVLAILELEAEVFEQRKSGGVRYVASRCSVFEWAEHIVNSNSSIGLPIKEPCFYVLTGKGLRVKIARVRPLSRREQFTESDLALLA